MAITHADIGGDEKTARRVLMRAREFAPCLDSLDPESEDGKNAIAILTGVLAEIPAPGSRRVRSLGRNGTTMSFDPIGASFTDEDIAALRSLCGADRASALSGLPAGSFPEDDTVSRMWPEGPYS